MITANIYEVVALLVALAFLILIIFAIPALIQVKKTARSVEDLTGQGRKTLDTLNALLKKTGESAGELDALVKRLKDLSTRLSTMSELISLNVRSPLATLLSLVIGFQYGLKYFIKSCEDRDKKDGNKKEGESKEGESREKGGEEDVKGQE